VLLCAALLSITEGLALRLYRHPLRSLGLQGVIPLSRDDSVAPAYQRSQLAFDSRDTLARDFHLGGDIPTLQRYASQLMLHIYTGLPPWW